MRVCVRVENGSVEESRSLRAWLREEPAVRRYGQPTLLTDDTAADEMGTALDVLTLVLGSGLSAAQLVVSIMRWRSMQDREVRVVIERDDRPVPVDTADAAQADTIAAKLEAD
jgi:Effector Associated Constant Component 1